MSHDEHGTTTAATTDGLFAGLAACLRIKGGGAAARTFSLLAAVVLLALTLASSASAAGDVNRASCPNQANTGFSAGAARTAELTSRSVRCLRMGLG